MKLNSRLSAMALVALALTACGKKEKVTLDTAEVTRGEISRSVTATGTVESVTSVDVGTQVTGIIDKIYVDFNSPVKEGELIAEIDKTLLQSELSSAEATMQSAKTTFEYTRTNYNRDVQLYEKQLISQYEFDTSKKDYQVAKAAYEKSQADIIKAKRNLQYAEIYSPMDGVVISRDVEVGQTVVSSMTVANLFTIADLNNMQVVANVDEADIGQVKTGQHVKFSVDAFPDDIFEGEVTQVRMSPTTESNVVTYEVLVSAPNPELKLIPGLTANLTIYIMEEPEVLLVPTKALRFTPREFPNAKNLPTADGEPTGEGRHLYLVKDNRLVPVEVTAGASNGANTAIESGVSAGDIVAVEYIVTGGESNEPQTEQSPFAPTPPGRKK